MLGFSRSKAATFIAVCTTVLAATLPEGAAALAVGAKAASAVVGLLGLAYAAATAPTAPDFVDDFVEKFSTGRHWNTSMLHTRVPFVYLKDKNLQALCIQKSNGQFKGASVFKDSTHTHIGRGESPETGLAGSVLRPWCEQAILPLGKKAAEKLQSDRGTSL